MGQGEKRLCTSNLRYWIGDFGTKSAFTGSKKDGGRVPNADGPIEDEARKKSLAINSF